MSEELTHNLIMIGKKNHSSIYERRIRLEVVNIDADVTRDWRIKIREYFVDLNRQDPHKVNAQS